MVKGFPFVVPKEYANLPQLKGRAEIQFTIKKADPDVCCAVGCGGVGGDVYVCMHMLFLLGCHQESPEYVAVGVGLGLCKCAFAGCSGCEQQSWDGG